MEASYNFQGAVKKIPSLAQIEAILPAHTVGMELNLNCLPDDVIYVSGFGG
jgi:hypothetical protein